MVIDEHTNLREAQHDLDVLRAQVTALEKDIQAEEDRRKEGTPTK